MKHTAKHALLGPATGLALALGALSAACVSRNPNASNHWAFESIETSVRQHVFGHASSDGGALRDAYLADLANIQKTFSRHVMSDNPDNPLLPHHIGEASPEYEPPSGGFQPSGN